MLLALSLFGQSPDAPALLLRRLIPSEFAQARAPSSVALRPAWTRSSQRELSPVWEAEGKHFTSKPATERTYHRFIPGS